MRRVVFTNHARVRAEERGLDLRLVQNLFKYSTVVEPPKRVRRNNRRRHSRIADKIEYRWANGVMYTVMVSNERHLILTVIRTANPLAYGKV
jgi:hypothetical protein